MQVAAEAKAIAKTKIRKWNVQLHFPLRRVSHRAANVRRLGEEQLTKTVKKLATGKDSNSAEYSMRVSCL